MARSTSFPWVPTGAQAAKAVTPTSAPGPGRLMAGIASYPAFSLAAPRSTPDDGVHGLPAPAAVRQQGFSLIEVLIVLLIIGIATATISVAAFSDSDARALRQ